MKNLKMLFWGMIGALGALALELAFSDAYLFFTNQEISNNYFNRITPFLFLAVFVEEGVKFILIVKNISRTKSRNEFIFSSTLIGLGFAIIENIFYLNNYPVFTFLLSDFVKISALHVLTASIIGYFVFYFQENKKYLNVITISLAFFIHLIFNYLIIAGFSNSIIFAYLFAVFLLTAATFPLLNSKTQDVR